MSKPVPRSRLNISYRTKIDGKPKKAKLPMRFLVLGDFTGHDRRLLGDRPVHSVLPGMKLDSFMQELKVSAPIDDPTLVENLVGRLDGTVTGKLVSPIKDGDKTGRVKFTGTGKVSGDFDSNGLGSFTGDVTISGASDVPVEVLKDPKDHEMELLLFGKVEPTPGAMFGLTGNIGQRVPALPDARPSPTAYVKVKVKVKLVEAKAPDNGPIDLEGKVTSDVVPVEITIPIRSLSDFKPLHLAESVPEIRRLVLLHRLVLEARNFISSFPELREMVKKELADTKEKVTGKTPVAGKDTQLGKLQAELRTLYPQLMLDAPAGEKQPVTPP